jgi:hypothetical protein
VRRFLPPVAVTAAMPCSTRNFAQRDRHDTIYDVSGFPTPLYGLC